MKISLTDKKQKGYTRVELLKGAVSALIEKGEGSTLLIGFEKQPDRRALTVLLRKVVVMAKQHKIKKISIDWKNVRTCAGKEIEDTDLGELAATAFLMANYEHNTYKEKPKEGYSQVEDIALLGVPKAAGLGITRGTVVGEYINACRELANTPGGDMTPKTLAAAAKKAVQGTKATVKVLGRREMQKLGMGAVLGIGRGAADEPQFIIVQYSGASSTKRPVVFVGKGVTFDSGGLNIKTGDHMYEMHMDMSGGAAAIYATVLAARLQLKKNVIALVPAVENAPGANAVHPGDILKSLSGKTIEILNTDAEGRVILADGITYAKRYNPALVVDVATLTGASLTALGTGASAFMTNTMEMVPKLMELAEKSGDYLWPFPLWESYDPMVKGTFGDVPNISTQGNSRYGGVIAGGKFLEVFAKELDCPWVHIDMAPRMTSAPGDQLAKGAAGEPVRLLLAIAEHYAH